MYCKECGFQLSEGTKYCPNCGTKVELSGMGNIEQDAVWGKIDDEDTAGDSNSVAKKAHWENGQGGTEGRKPVQIVKAPEVTVAQKKEIKKERKRERERVLNVPCLDYMDNIFVVNEDYYEDGRYISSRSWYVDAMGKRISGFYYDVSWKIINGTATIVQKNSCEDFACGKFENNKLKVITRPCFNGYSDRHCVNLKELKKSGFVLQKRLPQDLESTAECDNDIYFYDDTGLYKTQK